MRMHPRTTRLWWLPVRLGKSWQASQSNLSHKPMLQSPCAHLSRMYDAVLIRFLTVKLIVLVMVQISASLDTSTQSVDLASIIAVRKMLSTGILCALESTCSDSDSLPCPRSQSANRRGHCCSSFLQSCLRLPDDRLMVCLCGQAGIVPLMEQTLFFTSPKTLFETIWVSPDVVACFDIG